MPTTCKAYPCQVLNGQQAWPCFPSMFGCLQVLTTVKAYPVETDIVVVTNKPQSDAELP